jgi:magnesium-transporting ATPase (P-type)
MNSQRTSPIQKKRGEMSTGRIDSAYWACETVDLLRQLHTSAEGLTSTEAAERLREHGLNELREHRSLSRIGVLLKQIRSPLLLLLVFAAAASALSGEWLDSAIVMMIVIATVAIGYSREYSAQAAAEALRARVRVRANVLRDGRPALVPIEQVVPGDVVLLSAGSLIPADGVVLDATDCFVSEAVLTGRAFRLRKRLVSRRRRPVSPNAGIASHSARTCVAAQRAASSSGPAHRQSSGRLHIVWRFDRPKPNSIAESAALGTC